MVRLRNLWRNLVHRDRVDRDLDDEVRAILDLLIDEKLAAGMRLADARRAAMLELGGFESVKGHVRDARAGALVETFVQDVRMSARRLRKNPLFALTAALSLAIGIGANTAIFTVANALLFSAPVGVAEPGRLVDIGRSRDGYGFNPGSYPDYLDVRTRTTTLDGVYALSLFPHPMSLQGTGDTDGAERIFGSSVTLNYFSVLGARAVAGRLFGAADSEQPGASPVVVLSHRFWTRRFDRNPGVVGRTLTIDGQPFTVVGVASEGFQGTGIRAGDVWVPVTMTAGDARLASREGAWLMMGARLQPGVAVAAAAAEIDVIGRAITREHPSRSPEVGLRVLASSPVAGAVGPVAAFLALLTVIVSIVLMTACANLAGVLLARAAGRRREIAVCLAMGAQRGRLARQLLTETLVLFLIGGAAGVLIASGMTAVLVSLLPSLPFPVNVPLAIDGRAIAFTTGLSLIAAVLCGLAPALQASKADVVSALKDTDRGLSGRSRLRHAFVIAQVALSIVLVVVAGLFVRALQRVGSTDPGFEPRGVELASLDLSMGGYTDASAPLFARELVERVRALPSVQEATIAAVFPGGFEGIGLGGIEVPGVSPPDGEPSFSADWNIVEPGYFATLRLPLLAGRDFNAADRAGTQPVAIIGEGAARRFWPGQTAVGKSMTLSEPTPHTVEVIGVARDPRYGSLVDSTTGLFVYLPLQQRYFGGQTTIAARTTHGQRITGEIRALVASMNPNLPIVRSQTAEDYTALGLVPQRVAASVSGSLGLVGLLLAAIGIYGVTAYAVTRRTREIGIRLALGAKQNAILQMVLWQGMSMAVTGVAIGLLLAAGASRLFTPFLFGIPPFDPITFATSATLFAALGLAACIVPARRALRIDVLEALRYE